MKQGNSICKNKGTNSQESFKEDLRNLVGELSCRKIYQTTITIKRCGIGTRVKK